MNTAVQPADGSAALAGLAVLVIEDEYFIASDCAAALREHGARVLGPVPDLARGRALLAGERPDCVVLDINLKGDWAFRFAEELLERGVPAVLATGYDASVIPANLRAAPLLRKPIDTRDLIRVVRGTARVGAQTPEA
jgi:DNA-binding response OmpR family regulator